MRIILARFISIAAHPLVLLSLAAVLSAFQQDAPRDVVRLLVVVMGLLAATVLVFSITQVRTGKWTHADASQPTERRKLNIFLALVLFASGTLAWWVVALKQLVVGLWVAGGAIAVAYVLSRWLKMSQHVCFAVFAAGLVWPNLIGVCAGIAIASALAWSRMVLKKHTVIDVIVGAVVGTLSATSYHLLVA